MLVDKVVDYLNSLRTGLTFDDTILDGDGEVIRAAPHMNVWRIVVEGVDVNQYALYNEIEPMRLNILLFSDAKIRNFL